MILLHEPTLGFNEKKNLNSCIDSNWVSPKGKFVELFKKQLKILTKSKLKEAGYLLIDITEDEACSAIMEMYNFVVNNKKIDFSKKINELFWSNYKKYNQQRPVPGDIIISPSFISKNPELF